MKHLIWKTRQELIAAVLAAFASYDRAKLEKGWRLLYTVYRGILKTLGDNAYSKHGGDRKLQRAKAAPDRECPRELLDQARAEVTRLSQVLGFNQDEQLGPDSEGSGAESE